MTKNGMPGTMKKTAKQYVLKRLKNVLNRLNNWRCWVFGPGGKDLTHRGRAARLVMVVVSCAVAAWLWAQYRPPVTIKKIDLLNAFAFPGDPIMRRLYVYRHKRCETEVDILIFDSGRHRFQIRRGPFLSPGPLGEDVYVSTTRLPATVEAGPAEMRVSASYTCNWVHRIFGPVVIYTAPLEIRILRAGEVLQAY